MDPFTWPWQGTSAKQIPAGRYGDVVIPRFWQKGQPGSGPVYPRAKSFRDSFPILVVSQIHYEGGGSCTAATDVICPMYARVDQAKSLAQRLQPGDRRPVILCEYAHAMGNSSGNVREYWEAFECVNGLQVNSSMICSHCMMLMMCLWHYGGGLVILCIDIRILMHDM